MTWTKNYYHILNLTEPSSNQQQSCRTLPEPLSTADVRRAYKLALLSAHPDKVSASVAKDTAGESGKRYTVDDVKEAYGVLCDEKKKVEYDEWFLKCGVRGEGGRGGGEGEGEFVLGLEVLDLSDFVGAVGEDEEGEEEWTRGCRCGDEKGFRITEGELERAVGRGDKEVLVGCEGCSLWVRVGFEVEDEEG